MAQLPPSAVFGAAAPGQPVHVLLLIENSTPMMEHWQDLQRHILPGILGAVRIANPGVNVQIFWETTGKSQSQRLPQKPQRHFNDFPDIDIVGMPRNRLSPHFIRQSIDLFLLGNNAKLSATRHLLIVAMSNTLDDTLSSSDAQEGWDDGKWDSVATKLQENQIFLHLIANPLARLARVFDLFRKTMRFQLRQEVIPWQPINTTHCICHLSGSARAAHRVRGYEEWPEVNISPLDSPGAGPSQDVYDDEEFVPAPVSPMEIINSSNGSITLVSHMQAAHGLANRRRHTDSRRRPSLSRTTFFSEPSLMPSLRRERILNSKAHGGRKDNGHARRVSTGSVPLVSSSSDAGSLAADMRKIVEGSQPRSPTHTVGRSAYTSRRSLASSHAMPLVPSSPVSDSSGSQQALSPMSTPIRSTEESTASNFTDPVGYSYTYTTNGMAEDSVNDPTAAGGIIGSASNNVSTLPINDAPLPISSIAYHAPITDPLTAANTYATYATQPQMASISSYATPASSSYRGYASSSSVGDSVVHPGPLPAELRLASLPLQATTMPSMTSSVSTIDSNSSTEIEYVPASAPPDARGQVPFVFDATYEAQSAQRLQNLLATMSEPGTEEKQSPSTADATTAEQNLAVARAALPSLGPPRYRRTTGVPAFVHGPDEHYGEQNTGAYYVPSRMLLP